MDDVVTDGELSSLTYVTSVDASSCSDDVMMHYQDATNRDGIDGVIVSAEMLTGVAGCKQNASVKSGCLIAEAKVISRSAVDHNLNECHSVDKRGADADVELDAEQCDDNLAASSSFSITPGSSAAIDHAAADVPLHSVDISSVSELTVPHASDSHPAGSVSMAESDVFSSPHGHPGSEPSEAADMSATSCVVSCLNAPSQSSDSENLLDYQKHPSAVEDEPVQQPGFSTQMFGSHFNREFFPDSKVKTHTAGHYQLSPRSPVISAISNADSIMDVSPGLKQTVSTTDSCSVNNSTVAATNPACRLTKISDVEDEEKFDAAQPNVSCDFAALERLQSPVEEMLTELRQQAAMLRDLQRELYDDNRLMEARLSELPVKLENITLSLARAATDAASSRPSRKTCESCDARDVELINDVVERSIVSQLNGSIQREIRHSLLPRLEQLLVPITEQVHTDFSLSVSAVDSTLKDYVRQLVNTKAVESLRESSQDVVKLAVHAACRDVMIPAFDRCCRELFAQIKDAFDSGVQQNSRHLVKLSDERLKSLSSHGDDLQRTVVQLQSAVESLHTAGDQATSVCKRLEAINNQIHHSNGKSHDAAAAACAGAVKKLEQSLVAVLPRLIQDELCRGLQQHDSFMSRQIAGRLDLPINNISPVKLSSGTSASAPVSAIQLLHSGQVNAAFEMALSATDLNAVMSLCAATRPADVFGRDMTSCLLRQPVLLSLIQQLSVDLATSTTLKLQ